MATDISTSTMKPSKDPAPQSGARSSGPSLWVRMKKFYGEVRTELRKTTWPTREELKSHTQLVIGLLVVIGVVMFAFDYILGYVFRGLLQVFGASAV